jgi:ABC-type cobalamin transport system ATPase subunit
MNFDYRAQQSFKSHLPSARPYLSLWQSLNNPLNELFIAQKSLVDRLIVTLVMLNA